MSQNLYTIPDFGKGLVNNRVNPLNAPPDAVAIGENIDLSRGGIRTRPGYSFVKTGAGVPTGAVRALKQAYFPSTGITYLIAQYDGLLPLTWTAASSGGPTRSGATLVYDSERDRFLLFGGNYSGYQNSVYSFDANASSWAQLTTTGGPPTARGYHCAVYNAADDHMYIFAGLAVAGALNDCWKLNCDTLVWSQVTLSGHTAPQLYLQSYTLIDSTTLMVCGGSYSGVANGWAYQYHDINLSTGEVSEITCTHDNGPNDQRFAMSLAYDGSRYVYMAGGTNASDILSDAYRLDRTTNTWTRIDDLPASRSGGLYGGQGIYCSGRFFCIGGLGDGMVAHTTSYVYYDTTDDNWYESALDTDMASWFGFALAKSDDGLVVMHSGEGTVATLTFPDFCTYANTGVMATYGLAVSATHLPTTSAVFEDVYTLTSDSGVVSIETLGDRAIITEGVTDPPLVLLPGTLTTDLPANWASPMRVLITYDGINFHDISNYVLDNDPDSYVDIGGCTTRGYIVVICDVPQVHGFYLEFPTPNNVAGQITEFSETIAFDDEANISYEDLKGTIDRWYQDSGAAGHFETATKALAGAAVDVGGGLVKIPCVGHGMVAGDYCNIGNTTNYNGIKLLPSQASGDADNFIITAAYNAETFSGDDTVRRSVSLGAGKQNELVHPGVTVMFGTDPVSIAAQTDDGDHPSQVTLSATQTTEDVTAIYGVTVESGVSTTVAGTATVSMQNIYSGHAGVYMAVNHPCSVRTIVKGSDLTGGTTYDTFVISFLGWAQAVTGNYAYSTTATIEHASIVEMSSGPVGTTTPTPITWRNGLLKGLMNASYPAVSDKIIYTLDPAKDYLVTLDLSGLVGAKTYLRGQYPTSDTGNRTWVYNAYNASNQTPTGTLISETVSYAGIFTIYATPVAVMNPALSIIETTDTSQLDIVGIDQISSVTTVNTCPTGCHIWIAMSWDARNSWNIVDSQGNWRCIAKVDGSWKYNSHAVGGDTFTAASTDSSYGALREAMALSQNQLGVGTALSGITPAQWATVIGYPYLDFAVGLQSNGTAIPVLTSLTVNTVDSGGAETSAWVNGQWVTQTCTDGTASGGVTFGQNGSITFASPVTTEYTSIAGIPGYPFRFQMRGTSVGTTLSKLRYRAPCQALSNIGDGQMDTPLGFVFHDVSAGKILDYTIEMSDYTYTSESAAVISMESTDYIYVGYLTRFNELELIFAAVNNNNTSTLTAEYWDGLEWTELTILDGTSEDSKTFRRRGKIAFTATDDWKTNVPVEGMSFYNAQSGRMEIGYWVRLSVTANLTASLEIAEARVSPVPSELVKHKGVAVFRNRAALFNRPDAPGQVDISKEATEYCYTGYDTYSYNLGKQIVSGVGAWDTLLLGSPTDWNQLKALSPEGIEFESVESARHVPINSKVIVKAPYNQQDGSKYGLFFINQYGAWVQTGLSTDSIYSTSRVASLSDPVDWWETTGTPRLDLNYLHLACGEYWPTRNWLVWSVPMIDTHPFDAAAVTNIVTPPTGRVSLPATGHGLAAGDSIVISGSQYYDGTEVLLSGTTTNAFYVTATYVAETLSERVRWIKVGATQTTCNRLIVFDLTMGAWLTPFTVSVASLCSAFEYNANAPGYLGAVELLAGDYNGQVLKLFDPSATTDGGTAITSYLETQWLSADSPEITKELRSLWLYGTADNNFTISVYADGKTSTADDITETALTDPVGYTFVKQFQHADGDNIHANLFKIRFAWTGPADVHQVKLLLGALRGQLSTST